MSVYRLERNNEVEQLTDVVVESDSPAVRQRAAAALAEVETATDAEDDVVDTLATVAEDDEDRDVRAAAIDALDRLGDEAIERYLADAVDATGDGAAWVRSEALAEVLDEPVPELRIAAVTLLGRMGNAAAVPAVADRLDDEDHRVRERAARACGRLADPRAVDPLLDRTRDDVPTVRREVATALGSIGGSAAASGLAEMVDDPGSGVRRAAVTALGEVGDPSTVQTVTEALTDDHQRVRRAAVYALLSLMANAPAERSHEVREEVLTELREAPGSVVVASLTEILGEAQESNRRRNAAWLIGRVAPGEGTEALDALVEALGDDDQMTAKMAATSLTELGADRTEQRLIEVVEDTGRSSGARANAAFALGQVGGEPARAALDDLVDDTEDEEIRKRAFTALSRLGGR